MVLASVSVGHAQQPTSLQLAVWHTGIGGQRELVAELVRGFQRENPDIAVCTEWRGSEQARDLIRRWTGAYRDQAPDLTVLTDLWLADHAADIADLPDGLQDTLRRRFPTSVLARCPDAERVVGVPWVVATEALYYRLDLLSQAGLSVPESFDELAECAARLTDLPRVYGLGVPGTGMGGEELVHVLANALGPLQGDEAGDMQPTQPPFVAALSLLVELQGRGAIEPEVLTWSEIELAELMVQGRLAMMVARPWLGTVLDRAEAARKAELARVEALGAEGAERAAELRAAKITWNTAPLPLAQGGSGHMTVDWLVMLRTSDAPEAAQRLLAYLAHDDRQRALAVLGGVPATSALARALGEEPRWRGHLAALEEARGLPIDQWARLRVQLGDALNFAISGRRTPEDALRRAAEIR